MEWRANIIIIWIIYDRYGRKKSLSLHTNRTDSREKILLGWDKTRQEKISSLGEIFSGSTTYVALAAWFEIGHSKRH